MKDNPIKNEAQAQTAETYVEYLAAKLRIAEGDPEAMDKYLNEMIAISQDLADFREGAEWREPIAKLVVHNRGLMLPTPGRADLRLVVNN